MALYSSPAPVTTLPGDTPVQRPDIEGVLREAVALLSEERAREAAHLLDRWQRRRFVTLVVGEFKRGKSTLLNALIGQDLLPTGVPPVTTVPTRVGSGPTVRALASFLDGAEHEIPVESIRDYVDESRNPGNRQAVAYVALEVPGGPPAGVQLVDIPGLGSIHKHNTEAALAALPEADAVLVVASVDPPVGEADMRLLRLVREHAARVDLVLNKIDYLDEAGRRTAEDFTRRTLANEGFADVAVWPVSAREGLRARVTRDDQGWRRSGMEALAAGLARFLEEERSAALAKSLARKAGRIVAEESALVEMQRAAADRSARQLREIREQFRSRSATLEEDCAEALLIFRRRFDALFADYSKRATAAWKAPRAAFEAKLADVLASSHKSPRSEARETIGVATRAAVDAFMESFIPEEAPRLARAYAELCAQVGQAAADRVQSVWRLAADLLPFEPPAIAQSRTPPAPQPSTLQFGSVRLLLEDLQDAAARLLPKNTALRRLAAQAREEAEARYGRAVELSRETFSRAYEEHFRELLTSFEEASRDVARMIAAALTAGEVRATALEAGNQTMAPLDMARAAALREVAGSLREIAGDPDRGVHG